jgi:Tfp pilus assembly protein PilZ
MCNYLTYDLELGDTEVLYNIYYKQLIPTLVLNDVFNIVNELFVILQLVPLFDYKVWIDTVRGAWPTPVGLSTARTWGRIGVLVE